LATADHGTWTLTFALQNLDHYITYSVISAQPPLSYSSVVSTVRCYPITSGQHAGHTFVVWTGNFSSDAAAGPALLQLRARFADS
jgi:hypothetical protein